MNQKKVFTGLAATMAGFLIAGAINSADAATVTYDFTTANSGYTQSKTFGALTVSAKTVADDGSAIAAIPAGYGVGQFSGLGLGIMNSSTDNSHTIDGRGLNDLLILTFTSSVKIVSATFSYLGQVSGGLRDFAFFLDSDHNGSILNNLVDPKIAIPGSGSTGTYTFASNLAASKVFGIGAIYDAVCGPKGHTYSCFDSFKLASVTIDPNPGELIPQVPLPAGLLLLLSGLGAIARMKRKAADA